MDDRDRVEGKVLVLVLVSDVGVDVRMEIARVSTFKPNFG